MQSQYIDILHTAIFTLPANCLFDINVDDLDILVRLVQLVSLDVFDIMNDFEPRQHATEDRMFLVQPRRSGGRDKEL